jgi:hypothetical protein
MAVDGGATVVGEVGPAAVVVVVIVPGTSRGAGAAVEPHAAARVATASQPAYRRVHVVTDICRY